MCGIIGYIGDKKASEIIYEGLKRIEYRGYDSAGIAISTPDGISLLKGEGKIADIHKLKNFHSLEGHIGIGHTRWATHGPPCERNAHPHSDSRQNVVVVHNGIIENFSQLKKHIQDAGINPISDTDTEIIAHLISMELEKETDIQKAIHKAVSMLDGAYALAILINGEQRIYAARKNAPLVIGKGSKENFFASDIPALLEYTKDFILLEEGDFAQISRDEIKVFDADLNLCTRKEIHVDWTAQMAQKNGHEHFMLKEMLEQPDTIKQALSSDISDSIPLLKNAKNLAIIGCGTSHYAGLVFEFLLRRQGINATSHIASEYSYWSTGTEDVVVAITQSGETADTLSAIKKAKQNGAKVIAITNVVGSTITREADIPIYIGVGPEIGVLATKSFSGQLTVLYKIAYTLAQDNMMLEKLKESPDSMKTILEKIDSIKILAKDLIQFRDFFFISRSIGYPCALEGALKLKEVTYLHAEAYPAGELKHGPISLLQDDVAIFTLAPSGPTLKKLNSNIKECKARGAKIVVMSDDQKTLDEGQYSLEMPKIEPELVPLFYIVPLQLLSYFMALELGRDPDQPRNLAKSVTVE